MEGYVEIIEMGTILGGSNTEAGVTHNSGGVPTCANIGDATVTANIRNPSGGMFGGMSLINVLAGVDVSENAVALDNFRQTGKYDLPGDIKPDLRDVQPPVAVLFDGNVVRSATGFTQNVDAVSALFMMNNIYNEYVLDTVTKSGTDWVLTMPTKRYYYNADGTVNYLFQRNFVTNACDDILLTIWDREEQTPTTPAGFSPPPPPGKAVGLCWEANVLSFQFGSSGTSNILGSANSLTRTGIPYQNGWARLSIGPVTSFDGAFAHRLPASAITTTQLIGSSSTSAGNFIGLPIVGFAAQSFTNGTLTTANNSLVQANYAGTFVHRGTRSVVLGVTTNDRCIKSYRGRGAIPALFLCACFPASFHFLHHLGPLGGLVLHSERRYITITQNQNTGGRNKSIALRPYLTQTLCGLGPAMRMGSPLRRPS